MTNILTSANATCEARVQELHTEFGALIAARIVEAELAEFLWDSRIKQRYLGQHFDVGFPADDDEFELSRIAVLSVLDGRWYVASCLVDGEGQAADLLWQRVFDSAEEAAFAFERAA